MDPIHDRILMTCGVEFQIHWPHKLNNNADKRIFPRVKKFELTAAFPEIIPGSTTSNIRVFIRADYRVRAVIRAVYRVREVIRDLYPVRVQTSRRKLLCELPTSTIYGSAQGLPVLYTSLDIANNSRRIFSRLRPTITTKFAQV